MLHERLTTMVGQARKPKGTPVGGQFDTTGGGGPAVAITPEQVAQWDDYNRRSGTTSCIIPPQPIHPEQHYRYFFTQAVIPDNVVVPIAKNFQERVGKNPPLTDVKELIRVHQMLATSPDQSYVNYLADHPVRLSNGQTTVEGAEREGVSHAYDQNWLSKALTTPPPQADDDDDDDDLEDEIASLRLEIASQELRTRQQMREEAAYNERMQDHNAAWNYRR